jgi:hypothetical protein
MVLLIYKDETHTHLVLAEKLNDIETRLIHAPVKSQECVAQETGVSK